MVPVPSDAPPPLSATPDLTPSPPLMVLMSSVPAASPITVDRPQVLTDSVIRLATIPPEKRPTLQTRRAKAKDGQSISGKGDTDNVVKFRADPSPPAV